MDTLIEPLEKKKSSKVSKLARIQLTLVIVMVLNYHLVIS